MTRRFKILSCGGGTEETNLLIYVVYGGGLVLPLNLLSEVVKWTLQLKK